MIPPSGRWLVGLHPGEGKQVRKSIVKIQQHPSMMKNLRTLKGFPVQASQTQPPWQEEYHQWPGHGLDEKRKGTWWTGIPCQYIGLVRCTGSLEPLNRFVFQPQPQQTPEHHLNNYHEYPDMIGYEHNPINPIILISWISQFHHTPLHAHHVTPRWAGRCSPWDFGHWALGCGEGPCSWAEGFPWWIPKSP